MVRRPTVDRNPQPELYGAGYGAEAGNHPQGGETHLSRYGKR